MSKSESQILEILSTDERAMLMLIQEKKCCGKLCKHCPYVDIEGEAHEKGSTMLSAAGWELAQKVATLTEQHTSTSAE